MKRLIAILSALAYLAGSTIAQAGFLLNPYMTAVALPSLSFAACTASTSDLTTYTFSGHSVGALGTDRATVVTVLTQDALDTYNVSSVTIGGDSATEIADTAGAQNKSTALYIMSNAAGTSEDIVVTMSEAVTEAAICVWAAYSLSSLTAVASASASITGGAAINLNVNTSANGLVFAACSGNAGNTTTWTGLTEAQAEADNESISYSPAHFTEDSSAATPLGVTCDYTGSGTGAGASASFR